MAGSRVGEFARLFDRELERLHEEVAAYPDDESLWRVSGAITNPDPDTRRSAARVR